ncbi:uncharacterized protein LOC112342225 [Selaginella moellendorffii]|uniref:uncharacterized protein LOC112342225 n=1 Tax=Selaginella moellendorffii TaxID=88036 RepID=UPI000D1C68B4|nr:uncharacterized protein LOC112342225 [Selaginella moellendorffii]|eukprot:XP_024519464.1 uncharacterized protein LOC112342225 [Selaginella moellendorffii]
MIIVTLLMNHTCLRLTWRLRLPKSLRSHPLQFQHPNQQSRTKLVPDQKHQLQHQLQAQQHQQQEVLQSLLRWTAIPPKSTCFTKSWKNPRSNSTITVLVTGLKSTRLTLFRFLLLRHDAKKNHWLLRETSDLFSFTTQRLDSIQCCHRATWDSRRTKVHS